MEVEGEEAGMSCKLRAGWSRRGQADDAFWDLEYWRCLKRSLDPEMMACCSTEWREMIYNLERRESSANFIYMPLYLSCLLFFFDVILILETVLDQKI